MFGKKGKGSGPIPLAYDPRSVGCKCDVCPLKGKQPVLPTGPKDPDFAIVGEAPGVNEESAGLPFIGVSGQALDELLKAAGISRSRVWITNSLLCRAEVPNLKGPKRFDLPTYLAWIRAENKKRKAAAKAAKTTPQLIESPIDCCTPRLRRELEYFDQLARQRGRVNGLVVIPVGNFALSATTGKKGILKWRGSPLPAKFAEGASAK